VTAEALRAQTQPAKALPVAPRNTAGGILFILLAVLVFAGMDALVKLAAGRHPIGQIIFFRNLFAFLPLLFSSSAGPAGSRPCAPGISCATCCARCSASPAWPPASSPSPCCRWPMP
jgi:hypothetical protein